MDLADAYPHFDDAKLRSLLTKLLPSFHSLRVHRFNGQLCMQFDAVDDFVACSIGASSANLALEVSNTFVGKHTLPRTVSSCMTILRLASGLQDARLALFFMELALLRKHDGTLAEADFDLLNAKLHVIEADLTANGDAT